LHIYKRTLKKSEVYGIDFSEEMLSVAKEKLKRLKHANVFFKTQDIKETDFEDNYFDLCAIVFGIRNVFKKKQALRELYRITKPKGKILIMEFSYPSNKFFHKIYGFYLDRVLVNIGAALTRNRDAYIHLADSIKSFPSVDDFIGILKDCGWTG
jgi:demethylmenaquinone methyltransferase / 2-methoxy-6-polyprenyl-1,4-benzoquinol methylase